MSAHGLVCQCLDLIGGRHVPPGGIHVADQWSAPELRAHYVLLTHIPRPPPWYVIDLDDLLIIATAKGLVIAEAETRQGYPSGWLKIIRA